MRQGKRRILEGEIHVEGGILPFSGATIYLRIEDVSRADAPSIVIVEKILKDISIDAKSPRNIPFSIHLPTEWERMRYALSVHIDVDGDGKISIGDYITSRNYPIENSDCSQRLEVSVIRVNQRMDR